MVPKEHLWFYLCEDDRKITDRVGIESPGDPSLQPVAPVRSQGTILGLSRASGNRLSPHPRPERVNTEQEIDRSILIVRPLATAAQQAALLEATSEEGPAAPTCGLPRSQISIGVAAMAKRRNRLRTFDPQGWKCHRMSAGQRSSFSMSTRYVNGGDILGHVGG